MYQLIIVIFIIIPAIYLGRISYKRGIRFRNLYQAFFNGLKGEIKSAMNLSITDFTGQLIHLKKILYYLTFMLASILILTGFIPVIFLGKHLFGVFLLIHVLIAPFFCLSVTLLILLYANQHTFRKEDKRNVNNILYQKISFWVFSFFSIPAILSIAFSLFPIFGTDGLDNLLLVHQISVLFLTLSLLVHSYCLINSTVQNRTTKIL